MHRTPNSLALVFVVGMIAGCAGVGANPRRSLSCDGTGNFVAKFTNPITYMCGNYPYTDAQDYAKANKLLWGRALDAMDRSMRHIRGSMFVMVPTTRTIQTTGIRIRTQLAGSPDEAMTAVSENTLLAQVGAVEASQAFDSVHMVRLDDPAAPVPPEGRSADWVLRSPTLGKWTLSRGTDGRAVNLVLPDERAVRTGQAPPGGYILNGFSTAVQNAAVQLGGSVSYEPLSVYTPG